MDAKKIIAEFYRTEAGLVTNENVGSRRKKKNPEDKMKNKHAGSSFESFLQEQGIAEAVDAAAVKRAFVVQLEQRMKKVKRNKSAFRTALGSPTTAARLFSENTGTALETIVKAASLVGCDLELRLKPKLRTR